MEHAHVAQSLNRLAASATNHCLTGCVIGEVTGMVIATALAWGEVDEDSMAVTAIPASSEEVLSSHVRPSSSLRNSPWGDPPAYQVPLSLAGPGVSQITDLSARPCASPGAKAGGFDASDHVAPRSVERNTVGPRCPVRHAASNDPPSRGSWRLLVNPVFGPFFAAKLLSTVGVLVYKVVAAMLAFELSGFRSLRHEQIRVVLNTTLTVNAQLELSTVQESVTITAASPVVEMLAAVGLEHARPEEFDTREVRYGAWGGLLPPVLARPALAGVPAGVPIRVFRFTLDLSGKNKVVTFAQEETP